MRFGGIESFIESNQSIVFEERNVAMSSTVLRYCSWALRGQATMNDQKRSKSQHAADNAPDHESTSRDSRWNKSPELQKALDESSRDFDRLTVLRPTSDEDASYLEQLFESAKRPTPRPLEDWEERVRAWCDEYRDEFGPSSILEVNLRIAIYVFDQSLERVLLAYGLSGPQLDARDKNRMRRFPDVNVGVKAAMGEDAFVADRGHFLGHAAGGVLDINLFPQRRELNRGWSSEGKLFRRMEEYAATHLGTFVYHRATYNDDTWIPETLEYGLLVDNKDWWIGRFRNK